MKKGKFKKRIIIAIIFISIILIVNVIIKRNIPTNNNYEELSFNSKKLNDFKYAIWIPGSNIRTFSDEKLKFIAEHFAYFEILEQKDVPEVINKLKSFNEDIKIINYADGVFAYTYFPDPEKYPECFATSPNSDYPYNGIKDLLLGGYLMNMCGNCWKEHYLQGVKEDLQYGYDGVFVDDIGISIENDDRFDPDATDFYSNDDQFHECKKNFLTHLNNNLGNKLIIFNGFLYNPEFPNEDYLQVTDGGMREGYITRRTFDEFYPHSEWKIVQNAILNKVPQDKLFAASCKLDLIGPTIKNRMFCFTSYLLIQSPNIIFTFTSKRANEAIVEYYPEMNVHIGEPLENADSIEDYLDKGVYVRDFSKGKVIVNPGNTEIIYPLDKPYKKIIPVGGGNIMNTDFEISLKYEVVSNKISLSPQTGVILLTN